MTKETEELLKDCGCDTDYDICLEYLKKCNPTLCIECIYQDDYYFMGRAEFIKMAKECLDKKDKENE